MVPRVNSIVRAGVPLTVVAHRVVDLNDFWVAIFRALR